MTLFWSIAAAMISVALTLIIVPLFRANKGHLLDRKEQNIAIAQQRLEELMAELIRGEMTREQYTQAREELEQALYNDLEGLEKATGVNGSQGKWAAAVIAILFPLTTVSLYFHLGTPEAVTGTAMEIALKRHAERTAESPPASIDDMVQRLRDRLISQPDDIEGWLMLARSYKVMGQFENAASILEKVHKLVGDEPSVLVQYADALAMNNHGKLHGKPFELIGKALAKDPNHPTGLWLAGMAAAEMGNFKQAILHWNKLKPLLSQNPEALGRIQKLIDQAKRRLNLQAEDSSVAAAAEAENAQSEHKGVIVSVMLDPRLIDQVDSSDSVFIYAQALSGPPMPLAVTREAARDLPIRVVLDDSSAMIPTMKLSKFEEVRIGARISKSGNPIAQSGDLQGAVEPVQVGSAAVVNVKITDRIP